jgi:error-prone DNA polymerase
MEHPCCSSKAVVEDRAGVTGDGSDLAGRRLQRNRPGHAKRLRKRSAEALTESRSQHGPFCSAEDLALRIPSLDRKELTLRAQIGALNKIDGIAHRRDALWQVERAGKLEGPLLRQQSDWLKDESKTLPLSQMDIEALSR